jgi:hypothetical protein|nr:MAG TPA: hypothetical protein [Caudoviricetes sp.]
MKDEYLAKFDNLGRRETILVRGIHYITENGRQAYIDDGYIPITDEDYQHYIGNRGTGDNGTGYVRDSITGRPVSAPPALPESPVTENEDSAVSSEIMDIAEIILDMSDTIRALQKGGEKI